MGIPLRLNTDQPVYLRKSVSRLGTARAGDDLREPLELHIAVGVPPIDDIADEVHRILERSAPHGR